MREIRPYGSEGGAGANPPFLPLSVRSQCIVPMPAIGGVESFHEPACGPGPAPSQTVCKSCHSCDRNCTRPSMNRNADLWRFSPPRFMAPIHGIKVVDALHEPTVRSPGFSRFGPPEGGTPNKWRLTHGFMVPTRAQKRMGAFHEPTHPQPLPGGEQAFVRVPSVPLLGGVRGGFMVAMHDFTVVGAFHEAARPSNCSLPWESGAGDARTPNATAWSADSSAS